jgi:hypothetical protein
MRPSLIGARAWRSLGCASADESVAAWSWHRPPAWHGGKPQPAWSHLKRSLASLAKRNFGQLTAPVKTRLKRMQYRLGLLDGFCASTGLDLTPFL